jgi:dihydrofolate reductase
MSFVIPTILKSKTNSLKTHSKRTNLVIAMTENGGISNKGVIPFNFKRIVSHLSGVTKVLHSSSTISPEDGDSNNSKLKQNAVIMGNNTLKGLGNRPLAGRMNYILSENNLAKFLLPPSGEPQNQKLSNVRIKSNLDEAIEDAIKTPSIESIFIAGGTRIYDEAIARFNFNVCHVVHVKGNHICDNCINLRKFEENIIDSDDYEIRVIHEDDDMRIVDYVNKHTLSSSHIYE